MSGNPDPFDEPLPPRDRWGRPMLIPAGGSTIRVPYTRASSLGGFLSGDYGLTKWRMRRLARGMGVREDLAAMAAATAPFQNDAKLDRPTNTALDVIIADAMISGQAEEQANHGTAVHGFTEPGRNPVVPARMQDDVASFWSALQEHGMSILATELFVANDALMSAGTFDHVVSFGHGPTHYVADKKTGDLHGMEFAVQCDVYAGGDLYNIETDERRPLVVSRERAIIMHVIAGKGRTDLYWLDLERGHEMALRAAKTRDDRLDEAKLLTKFEEIKTTPSALSAGGYTLELLQIELSGATSRAQLDALWKDPQTSPFWDEATTAFAQRKWHALSA